MTEYVALDIGGTLIKMVYATYSSEGLSNDYGSARLKFKIFDVNDLDQAIHFIKDCEEISKPTKLVATGGGAFKYESVLKDLFIYLKQDEMECVSAGLRFLIGIPEELFCVLEDGGNEESFQILDKEHESGVSSQILPLLLVNIGSGVSILKVDSNKCERVSGTSLGGGTFLGLVSLLTGVTSFDEAVSLSQEGDEGNVDLLVGDIYGGDYSQMGLSASLVASSFGKSKRNCFAKREDIAASLLKMVSYNIGHVSYLLAKIHNVKNIFFGGYFLHNSRGTINAVFLRHDGYLGCIGALKKAQNLPFHGKLVPGTSYGNAEDAEIELMVQIVKTFNTVISVRPSLSHHYKKNRDFDVHQMVQFAILMSVKVRSRRTLVKLHSMAGTGYIYYFQRLRSAPKMSLIKYDPIGTVDFLLQVRAHVLFSESKPPAPPSAS